MTHTSRLAAAIISVAIAVTFLLPNRSSANGPPIHGESAFVTGLNGAAFRTFTKVVRKFNSSAEVLAVVTPIVFPYELVDNRLIIGLGLPLVYKRLKLRNGTKRTARFGIGDLNLFAKFKIYQRDRHQHTFRVAGKVSLTFPTGTSDLSDDLGQLPLGLQRGTGAVSPSVMLIATALWRRVGLNVDVGYTAITPVDGTDRGDVLRYDVGLSFRMLPWVFKTYPAHQLNLMLEFNGSWTQKTRVDGVRNPDSGGHAFFISPGLQYMYSTVIVEVSAQIPIPGATAPNGKEMKTDWAGFVGIRWLIF